MRVSQCMPRHLLRTTACVLVLGVTTTMGAWQVDDTGPAALRRFAKRIGDYVALHRRLERQLPALDADADPTRTYVARQLMATAIREARAGARQGDIFDPAVSIVLRALIVEAVQGRSMDAVLGDQNDDPVAREPGRAVVNEPLPKGTTHEMPCVLLRVLPALPEDVEYRIVGRDLVLWDIHANLVIDVMPDALSAAHLTARCNRLVHASASSAA